MMRLEEETLEQVTGGTEIRAEDNEDPMEAGRCPVCASLLKVEEGVVRRRYFCPTCGRYVREED